MDAVTWAVQRKVWQTKWRGDGLAMDTFWTYARDIDRYQTWCSEQSVQSTALSSGRAYVDHVLCSKSRHAARHAARALKAYGKYLVWDEMCPPTPGLEPHKDSGPFQRLTLPKEPPVVNAPTATDDDLEKLLAACTPSNSVSARSWEVLRDKAIITTLAFTGMRRGEVAGMTLDDVDLLAGTVRIPKTKNNEVRNVKLNSEVVRAILRYHTASQDDRPEHERGLWMSAHDMSPLKPGGISQMLYRRAQAAGVGVAAHAFRRRQAGEWMARGGSESGLMTNNGWKSPTMILRYSKAKAEANAMAESERLFG